ncbi:hypothetical protein BN2537_13087 [Streptomyces venezuelae]|nr:hypothetical protein BN2537_13087 [Streptomyces venezuelae]
MGKGSGYGQKVVGTATPRARIAPRSRTANEAPARETGGASKTEGTYKRYERGLLRLRRAGPQRNL